MSEISEELKLYPNSADPSTVWEAAEEIESLESERDHLRVALARIDGGEDEYGCDLDQWDMQNIAREALKYGTSSVVQEKRT